MNHINFNKAIECLIKSHSVHIRINQVKPHGQVSRILESPTIEIVSANAGALERLSKAGFNLSVGDGVVTVNDFSVKHEPI
jgi:hypothetical protein